MIGQRALNLLGFLTLILVFVNMFLLVGNQSLQRVVGERQQFIMQSIQAQSGAREVIAADIVKLASDGNAGAQRIVFELRKRGFKIGADSKASKPATK